MYIDGKLQNRVLKGRGGIVTPGERAYAREDDVALILHTSGTTGKPVSPSSLPLDRKLILKLLSSPFRKVRRSSSFFPFTHHLTNAISTSPGVPLTHLNLYTTMRNIVNTYTLTSRDRSYLVMPLFHVHGLLAGFLAPLLSGGSVVVPEKFSAGVFWKDFVAEGCTWYTVRSPSSLPSFPSLLLRRNLADFGGMKRRSQRFIKFSSAHHSPPLFLRFASSDLVPQRSRPLRSRNSKRLLWLLLLRLTLWLVLPPISVDSEVED